MDIFEAIYGRRSTRTFSSQPIARTVLERLIDAAVQAPSAMNEQPWDFAVIENTQKLDNLAERAKRHMFKALENDSPNHFRSDLSDPGFHIFYHAPALIVISAKSGVWAVQDGTLAAQNLMLTAHALGLGSCWIGFAQRWLETEEGKSAIDLPDNFVPIAPVVIGYPSEKMPPVPRNSAHVRWIE